MKPLTPRLAYYVLKSRAYHAILRTPRFRTAKSADPAPPPATERHPDRPQRATTGRAYRFAPDRAQRPAKDRPQRPAKDRPQRFPKDRPQRSVPDRPHRRTKALAG